MFKVEFTKDKIPSTYYLCLECGEILKTALDCVNHYYDKHRHKKAKVLFCDDATSTYKLEYYEDKQKKHRQARLDEFFK